MRTERGLKSGGNGTAIILCTFACLIMASSQAGALELVLPLEDVTVISNDQGQSRILFGFGRLDELREELITSAWISIPLPGYAPTSDLTVEVHGLTTAWRGSRPTWNSPWTTAGGDLDDTDSYDITLDQGRRADLLRLDVTHMVRGMVDGSFPANGFVLSAYAAGRTAFNNPEMAVLGELKGGKLTVNYRKLTAHGLRGGPDELLKRREQRAFDEDRPRPARDARAEP
jgi:hypothetical protein